MASSAGIFSTASRSVLSPTARWALVSSTAIFRSRRTRMAGVGSLAPKAVWIWVMSPLPPQQQSISASLAAAGASESRSQICSGSSPGTKVTLSRRAKYIPAGSMAFTASLTVQKYRSRIHRARWIPFSSRTGASSRQDSTGFSVGVFSSCRSRESTMPSDPRFPLPKGTATRIPGSTCPSSSGGTR